MPSFTIETNYRLPVYRQITYEADNIEDACRLAMADDDWTDQKLDHESASDVFVSGVWLGIDVAYCGCALEVREEFREQSGCLNPRPAAKIAACELPWRLWVFVFPEVSFLFAIHRARASRRLENGSASDTENIVDGHNSASQKFVVARIINRHGDMDYLCGWDPLWGTTTSLSLARALKFSTMDEALRACRRARTLVPHFVDGRRIDYRVIAISGELETGGCDGNS